MQKHGSIIFNVMGRIRIYRYETDRPWCRGRGQLPPPLNFSLSKNVFSNKNTKLGAESLHFWDGGIFEILNVHVSPALSEIRCSCQVGNVQQFLQPTFLSGTTAQPIVTNRENFSFSPAVVGYIK